MHMQVTLFSLCEQLYTLLYESSSFMCMILNVPFTYGARWISEKLDD
jgi:hypothetical protein